MLYYNIFLINYNRKTLKVVILIAFVYHTRLRLGRHKNYPYQQENVRVDLVPTYLLFKFKVNLNS